ncbi:heavy metal translocating P-type ATPase [uncultured Tateyamaria sp.]|uniref:heavy metal translocating P-type ATPase n=1 Tax=uncultured Tateyamaria sp. TaxID=455651 RepID=UPI00260D4B3A|nr:heavy metal translocating P-type ATPase [uncultured Tateyamaria sp.]
MSVASCPGCIAAGPAAEAAGRDAGLPTHELILPGVHCVSCIRSVEGLLNARPDIAAARVNLSRKRVAITAEPGMDPASWITALTDIGFEAHEARDAGRHMQDDGLTLRLGIAGFAMMNVMLLSVAVWSGATDATRDFFHWIAATISLPAAIYCAQPFFRSAWSALRAARLNMDVPIALAILLACGLSLYETMHGGEHAYFDAALSLTFFLLGGRVLEKRMRQAARSAAADLAALEPMRVTRIEGDTRVSVPVDEVAMGDTLWLAAGARVPVDGVVNSDVVQVDRSALTGESEEIAVAQGAPLTAGEVVLTGPVTMTTTVAAKGSTLRRLIQIAAQAEGARSRYTSLADRAAGVYAPLVHGLSFAAFVGWSVATGDMYHALTIAIATLIITCPCALGLAVPAVATVATGRLFRMGLLVKSETALERLAEVDTVVFDKTGTLSAAALVPSAEMPATARAVLKALAQASAHPLSRSVLPLLGDVRAADLDQIAEQRGNGVSAVWQGRPVRFGNAAWVGAGQGTVLSIGSHLYAFDRKEQLFADAGDTVARLRDMGLEVHLLTGDSARNAARVAAQLGVEQVHAQVDPEAKQDLIEALQAEGRKVVMVGDGLNDTLALTRAWASIAPGTALEASQNAADVVLLGQHLSGIPAAIGIARSARRRILENFGLAACYNAVAIPLALAGFATPLMAALAMSTSSITVTVNALRTRATP